MSRSRLRIPAAKNGTARNMNTIAKMAKMAEMASTINKGKYVMIKSAYIHFAIAFAACSLLTFGSAAHAAVLSVDQNDGGCSDVLGTPYCTIGAAVASSVSGDTVSVAPGVYVENVIVSQNLSLVSTGGRAVTTIQGISSVGALGAVQIQGTTTAVDIGGPGSGFRIEGIDNGFPGVENAAVYVRGTHSNARIRENEIVAMGEAGLLSEFGATISGFLVDGNIFSGQTFFGPVPADCGFANQFTTPNVPRQLVTMGGGSGGGSTSNTTFTNNIVTGTAGGGLGGACVPPIEQGNTLVTIDSNGATISANTFAGTTGRFATSLRARGPNTVIVGNSFSGVGLRPVACHVFVQNTGNNLGAVVAANTYLTPLLLFPNDPLAVVGTICPAPDADGDQVADNDDNCPASVPDGINLSPNQYASNNFATLAFEVGPNQDQSIVYDMALTGGCTCRQIVATLGAGNGHLKKGCSPSLMESFTGVNAHPDRQARIGRK